MKFELSTPDALAAAAHRAATERGMSRSELFARAVAAFLQSHDGGAHRGLSPARDTTGVDPRMGAAFGLRFGLDSGPGGGKPFSGAAPNPSPRESALGPESCCFPYAGKEASEAPVAGAFFVCP